MPSKIRGGTADKHLADMHIPRVSALGAGGGAAPLDWKFGPFEFATDYAAGALPAPYTEAGAVGTMALTDTGTLVSITSGLLRWTTRTGNNDPRLISSATLARAAGLALHVYAKDTKWQAGFDTVNTRTPQSGAFQTNATEINCYTSGGLGPVLGDVRVVQNYYNFVVLLQSDGAHWFVKNAAGGTDYPYWTHLYFSTTDATANLYAGIACSNGNPSIEALFEDLRVALLTTPALATDYGFATSYAASAAAEATALMSANGLVVCNRTFATNDVFELDVRRTDDDNRWIVRCDQALSTIKLIQRVAGVETERTTAAQTFTNATTYRLAVRCVDYSIKVIVNDTVRGTYTAASFNSAETGVKVSHAVTKLAAFPRILFGANTAQLNQLAAPFVDADPSAGVGESPAQEYIDRVMALTPDVYLPLQEQYGFTALDYTGNARSGTFDASDGFSLNQNGKYGVAYRCTGVLNGHIDASAALTAAFNVNEFTVCFWIKLTLTEGSQPKFMEAWDYDDAQYFAIEGRVNDTIYGDTIGIFMKEVEGEHNIGDIQVIPNETWCHFAFFNSLSTGTVGIYWNGVLHEYAKTSVLGIPDGVSAGNPYFFGGYEGLQQHIAIFNRKLSQAEIDTICT